MRKALAIFLLTLAFVQGICQEENSEAGMYSNLSAGFGVNYGGFGINAEAGYKHVSIFACAGYAPKRSLDLHTIPSSINFNGGLRYYIKTKSDIVFPRVGANFGWITNYYSDSLYNKPYSPHASGVSVHTGVQVYSNSGIVFSLDLVGSSRLLLFNQAKHPHFFTVYVRPSIGIGIDLNQIFSGERSKTIKNEELNPLG